MSEVIEQTRAVLEAPSVSEMVPHGQYRTICTSEASQDPEGTAHVALVGCQLVLGLEGFAMAGR